MTKLRLLLRNVRYFRWSNLAVLAGMAVATAVLTGALMVGDSVRGSLRALAVQRLGPVDHALVGTRFFSESLPERVAGTDSRFRAVPGLIVRGAASDESGERRTAGVQIAALGEGDGTGTGWVPPVARGGTVINSELAGDLGISAAAGKTVILSIPTAQDTPRDATLARRARQDALSNIRAAAGQVVTEPGVASMFSLEGS